MSRIAKRLKASTNEVIASIQARETQLVVQLSEAISDKNALVHKMDQMKSEIDSKTIAYER
jgi:hypothetical protein